MYSTQYLTENYNFQSCTFAVGKLIYRAGSGIGDDVARIRKATPTVLHIASTALVLLAMVVIAAIRYILPALPVVAKALALVAIPVGAMYLILTVPGLALCLVAFALFALATLPSSKGVR